MNDASRRLLIGPAVLAAIGLMLFATAPLISSWLHLSSSGTAAVVLHDASGIWMWLALAWLAARCLDLLLGRVAMVSRGGVPYPRLLTDLLSAALFAAA